MPEAKTLPSSPKTEADVIGICISEGAVYWRVIEQMGGDDTLGLFHDYDVRLVAGAIKTLTELDRPVNRSTIIDELSKNAVSERLVPSVSGYITNLQITNVIRSVESLRASVNVLIEERSKRSLLIGLETLHSELLEGEISLTAASSQLRDISVDGGVSGDVPLLGEIISTLERENALGVEWRAPTGLKVLDAVLNGGYEPRRMTIIGARPKVGKSMILFNGALEALANGCAVLFVSLELSDKELWTKMLSAYSTIEQRLIQDIFDGKKSIDDLSYEQQEELADCKKQLQRSKLHSMFVKDVRQGVDSVVSAIMSLRLKYGEDHPIVVFVDYIQLFVKSGFSKREEIEDASRKLKLCALEFNVSVIAAAQVNRSSASSAGEGTGDGMPRAYMLRDSGSLEQDADIVMMLNRPFLQDDSVSPELMQVFVELNRTGPSGKTLDVRFLPEFQQLADFDLDDDDPEDENYDEPRQRGRASRMEDDSSTFDEDEAPRPASRDYDADDQSGDNDRPRRSSRRRDTATADSGYE